MRSETLLWPLASVPGRRARLLGGLGLLLALFAVPVLGGLVAGQTATWLTYAAWTLFSLIASLRCALTARRAAAPAERRAWALFAAAAFSWFLGMLYLDWLEWVQAGSPPYPTPANYLFLAFAPLFMGGVFFYRRTAPSKAFSRMLLGTLGVIAAAVLATLLVVLLEPLRQATGSTAYVAFSVADPAAFTIAFLFTLVCLAVYGGGEPRVVLGLLFVAISIHAVADTLYFYGVLSPVFQTGPRLDLAWMIAFSIQTWAAFEHEAQQLAEEPLELLLPAERSRGLQAVVPALLLVGWLAVALALPENVTSRTLLPLAACGVLFALFLGLREWWTYRLERELSGRLEGSNEALQGANLSLAEKIRERDQELEERRRAQRLLQESERRFRDFAETAADWFWELDSDLCFTFLSDRYEAVHGVPAELHIGRNLEEVFRQVEDGAPPLGELLRQTQPPRPFDYRLTWSHPDGTRRILRLNGRPVHSEPAGWVGYRGTGHDLTAVETLSQELSYKESHDPVTGLLNRGEVERRLQLLLQSAHHQQLEHVLCVLDLDQFKVVNETCGHAAGDELLRQVARALGAEVRLRDSAARLSRDEFAILLEDCQPDAAQRLAEGLLATLEKKPFLWGKRRFPVRARIGLVPITSGRRTVSELLSLAEIACRAAQELPRARVYVYREDDHLFTRQRREVQALVQLRRALEEGRFRVLWEPLSPLAPETGEGLSFELLLRLLDAEDQLVAPGLFLPVAERYRLSAEIDRWVIGHAIAWLGRLPAAERRRVALCSINLSGHSLGDEELLPFLDLLLREHRIAASQLCFEITETVAVAHLDRARRLVDGLRERGCRIALDDFGRGVSSFAYLKSLAVDFIKIDGLFVREIASDETARAMVRSIHQIAHVMGKQTIAEFVETQEVLEELRRIGVDYAQGYLFGRPRPLDGAERPTAVEPPAG